MLWCRLIGCVQYQELDLNGTSSVKSYSDCYDTVVVGRTPIQYIRDTDVDGVIVQTDFHCRTLQHAGNVALGFGVFGVLVIWAIIAVITLLVVCGWFISSCCMGWDGMGWDGMGWDGLMF